VCIESRTPFESRFSRRADESHPQIAPTILTKSRKVLSRAPLAVRGLRLAEMGYDRVRAKLVQRSSGLACELR
jgi:hypothetical protein